DLSSQRIETVGDKLRHWGTDHGVKILIILIVGFIIDRVVSITSEGLTRHIRKDGSELQRVRFQRAETLSSILNSVVRIAIIAIVVMTVLDQIGINIGPILAGAGVIGLAVGFGAQALIRDFLSGFF